LPAGGDVSCGLGEVPLLGEALKFSGSSSSVHQGASAGASGDQLGSGHLTCSIEVLEAPHDGIALGGASREAGPGRVVADGCSDGSFDGNPVGTGSQAVGLSSGDDSLECSVVLLPSGGIERHAEAPARSARSGRANLSKGSASQLLTALEGFACRISSCVPSNSSEIVVNSDNEGVTVVDISLDLVVGARSSVGRPFGSW